MIQIRNEWDRRTGAHVVAALLIGLALRLFFVFCYPAADLDSELYQDLGRSLVEKHTYVYDFGSGLVPTDIRVPGYPLFLGFIYLFSHSPKAILVVQALVDLGGCLLLAVLAAVLAPEESRKRVAIVALWLGATCPFVANYAALALTEVLATFLTTAALLILVCANRREFETATGEGSWKFWFLGGVLVGLGALVRPETPIMLAAPAIALGLRWFKPAHWLLLIRTGLLLAAGLLLALLPWAARNWVSMNKVQFLTTRYFQSPGSYIPEGFYAWTHTWLTSYGDGERVMNRLEEGPLQVADFPSSAFDSPQESEQVASLLEGQHTEPYVIGEEPDAQFAALARERTARRPVRTYLAVPLRRMLTLWFTPRTELLPLSGNWWPAQLAWTEVDADWAFGFLFATLNFLYLGLALVGGIRLWKANGVALLVAFVVVRTIFIAVEHNSVEPRLVLPCVPAVLALGALTWSARVSGS